ncbi:hypothetical protein PM082_019933 [Marasmius tenuissimus]|nr:hypothetical protein PM082_019933 [Marasmius tenuissimus]
MLWGFVMVSFITLPVALSLAEICAKYPTSAGAYYWCYRLASPRNRLLLSWINGWLTLVGNWTISLSVTFGTAQLLVAGVQIYRPEWVVEPWQTYLTLLGVTTLCTSVGIFFNDALPTLDILAAYWTLLGVIGVYVTMSSDRALNDLPSVTLICLSVKAASGRHSAGFAFGHFDPSGSGWTPGWSFFIGLLPLTHSPPSA